MSRENLLRSDAFTINAQEWCKRIEDFIRETFEASHQDGIVVPISGGLDSSVVAALCAGAIGKEKVLGLQLPERMGNPEANYYGDMLARYLGIKTMRISISPMLRGLGSSSIFLAALSGRERWKTSVSKFLGKKGQSAKILYRESLEGKTDAHSRKFIANVSSKQRVRLVITYKIAEERNLMVAGSAHKTEQMVGLFVKYGIDDGADIMPLKNIYRSQTLQLAEYLNIPQEILGRSPNPDILPGVTNKYLDYFGLDYLTVELIILGLERGLPTDEIARQLGLENQTVKQMADVVRLSERYRSHASAPEFQ